MKPIILTIDYELFLGNQTGTVEKCMIEPTYKLAEILDINHSKMTVFWDILHYRRLIELENDFPEIKNDKTLIDKQISFLISKGHDIQLHLHPHWLDAAYTDGKWNFNYEHFKIHSLSEEDDPKNINTIIGCISITKQLMEREVRKYLPDYKVTTFRAGGYLVEPFTKLKKAFEQNNIFIDSSVLPGISNFNNIFSYNFSEYHDNNLYHFDESPSEKSLEGKFIEIPITTLSIPGYKNLEYTLLRRIKYNDLESGRMGTGSGEAVTNNKKSLLSKIISSISKPKIAALTTDGNFKEKLNYMLYKVKNNSMMILHSKLLNSHTLNILKDKLLKNEIKFISINNFLKGIE